jgi:inner membrane protein
MDILTHTLSGFAVGTLISSFSGKRAINKLQVLAFSGLGAALPDLDAISLWSGFDKTFGRFLGLSHTGKVIYFSKFWYSHHGFFHSILAAIVLALFIAFAFYFIKNRFGKSNQTSLIAFFQVHSLVGLAFVCGYLIHLLEDMPTPACDWGGVRFFFPLKTYIGGTGEIWWWNNYDIFILVVVVILINGLILCLKKVLKVDIRKIALSVFVVATIWTIILVKARSYDFNYVGQTKNYQKYEQQSKEIQKKILGKRLYGLILQLDNQFNFNF